MSNCWKFANIGHIKAKSKHEQCSYSYFYDLNTGGLSAALNCDKGVKMGSFRAYPCNKGVHVVGTDREKKN